MIKRKSSVIENNWYLSHIFLDCPPGYYGYACNKACSGHCLNNTVCDHITGTCTDGCLAGYVGKLCDDGKTISLYQPPNYFTLRTPNPLISIHCFISVL